MDSYKQSESILPAHDYLSPGPEIILQDAPFLDMIAQSVEDDFVTANAERGTALAERDLGTAEAAALRLNATISRFATWFAQKRVLLGMLQRSGSGRAEAIQAGAATPGSQSFLSHAMISCLCQTWVLLALLPWPASKQRLGLYAAWRPTRQPQPKSPPQRPGSLKTALTWSGTSKNLIRLAGGIARLSWKYHPIQAVKLLIHGIST